VGAAQAGDRDALDQLLRRHHDRLHAVCRRIAGGSRDADDATQEAMIRIVRGLAAFDGRSSFTTWAYRIATNTALDELRKRNRRPQLHRADRFGDRSDGSDGTDIDVEQIDPGAHHRVDAVIDRIVIDDAIAGLPDDYRVAVVLRDVADLDYDEIAAVLGVPVGTVKSRIARGRARLVARLGNQEPSDRRQTDGS
jgi:RNA polymerase sigma-70 factor, ECF subfamily